jgi:hypothetical protein
MMQVMHWLITLSAYALALLINCVWIFTSKQTAGVMIIFYAIEQWVLGWPERHLLVPPNPARATQAPHALPLACETARKPNHTRTSRNERLPAADGNSPVSVNP